MLVTVGTILLAPRAPGPFLFPASTAVIHALIVLAVIAIAMHVERGRRLAA
jgi:hypothetical protein